MLTSPSGKSYIGQTIRPIEERLKEHKKTHNDCVAISNAIQKYGWDNFEKHWYEVPDDDLNDHEALMIEVLGTMVPEGYNLKEGGGSHGRMSEATRRRMSEAQQGQKNGFYGKTHTEKAKQKLREINMGKITSDETKQKQREALQGEKSPFFGKKQSEETKQKNRESQLGKTMSDKTKEKISVALIGEKNHNSKAVYQYDIRDNLIRSFGSTGEAARSLNKSDGSKIRNCARGTQKTAYGFKWSYTEL
jgi:hypothetical protein